MNTLDPDQPSGVTIEATDEDGADNNVIEYSIYCDYGEGGSNFGFLIDAASGVLRVNTSMGETDRDYECIILVRASTLWGVRSRVKFCKTFLTCSAGRWADSAANVQPNGVRDLQIQNWFLVGFPSFLGPDRPPNDRADLCYLR